MKRLGISLVLLSLTGCSPQSLVMAWDWNGFTRHSDQPHFDRLMTDLSGCNAPDCSVLSGVRDEMIDALSAKVKSSDERTIKIGLRVYPLITHRGLPALRLARRYGVLATLDPRLFLQVMKPVNGLDRTLVLATSAEAVGNPVAQQEELKERRDALSTVNDPALKAMRNRDIALFDVAVIRLYSDYLHPIPIS